MSFQRWTSGRTLSWGRARRKAYVCDDMQNAFSWERVWENMMKAESLWIPIGFSHVPSYGIMP
jgi:hypothetical protein